MSDPAKCAIDCPICATVAGKRSSDSAICQNDTGYLSLDCGILTSDSGLLRIDSALLGVGFGFLDIEFVLSSIDPGFFTIRSGTSGIDAAHSRIGSAVGNGGPAVLHSHHSSLESRNSFPTHKRGEAEAEHVFSETCVASTKARTGKSGMRLGATQEELGEVVRQLAERR